MSSHKFAKVTVTIPIKLREWLKDHPEIDVYNLLQQAIRNQMMKSTRKT